MSLLTLPKEIKDQIFSYILYNEDNYYCRPGLRWYDAASSLRWREDWRDYEYEYDGGFYEDIRNDPPSELVQAMPDMEVEALTMPDRRTECSILYVCRQLYNDAIPLLYELNIFHFWDPWLLADFSDLTDFVGNVRFIRSLSITVDLWDNGESPNLWKLWQGFLEDEANGRGLGWHFPGLKSLQIEFEPSSRMNEPWGHVYVDGRPHHSYRRRFNQRPSRRQAGFDSFVDTLRRTVRVEKVRLWCLHDDALVSALEREMMGVKNSSADWLPRRVYDPTLPSVPVELRPWNWEGETESEDEAAEGEAASTGGSKGPGKPTRLGIEAWN